MSGLSSASKIRTRPMPPRSAFGKDELSAIVELFDFYKKENKDFGYQGNFERRYTDAFANYMGGGFVDAVSSGTAALYVSIASLQLPLGSHVLVSPVTDPGTISAIILNNLVPVLMDSALNSYNIGFEEFESRITDRTKAVVVVHASGKAAPSDAISMSAEQRGLYVVEDCSQAHGAVISGKKVGTFGDVAAFSTMYRKSHATGGCGGVLFTKEEGRYWLIRAYADRGKPFARADFDEKNPGLFLFPALNLNIDELSCAIGIRTLSKLDDTISRRVDFLKKLHVLISERSEVCSMETPSDCDSPFFQSIFVDLSRLSVTKNEFAEAVRSEGIDINPDYRYVVCEWPWMRRYLADGFICENAISFRNTSFNLLFNENYGEEELEDIIEAIVKVERAFIRRKSG